MAADCLAEPLRHFEADSAAPWQRAPPIQYVQVAVRAAWLESCPRLRAPRGGDPAPSLYCCARTKISLCPERKTLVYVPGTNISPLVELQFTRNAAIDMTADCLAAPRRNFEADSAAPWQRAQRAPPLDHVEVAAVRTALIES